MVFIFINLILSLQLNHFRITKYTLTPTLTLTQLIWSDNNPHKLLIKESLIIKAYEPELNRTTHSVPLYIYPNGIDKQHLPRLNY
jgi:hypothetical protein